MARRSSGPSPAQLRRLVSALPARFRPWALALLVVLAIAGGTLQQCRPKAPPPGAKPTYTGQWQKLTDCRFVDHPANDGDSFHTVWQGQDYIFRLYFVDTAETDKSLKDRIAEQAAYWGITPEQTVALGKRAVTFTREHLAKNGPLTVQTRWRDALGRSKQGRVYALVTDARGRDLGELLVSQGLARIFGMNTNLPDGSDSRVYTARLRKAEAEAKRARRGGWAR
jgi:endonuclease YncB( thermonuclease family)